MGLSTHRIRAFSARKVNHPVYENVEKHWMTIAARDLPRGISTSANAREPIGLNRRVYRDVKESLNGDSAAGLGSFDLMNKGITILAQSVKLIDKQENLYDLVVDDAEGGIVDGAHTARLIEAAINEGKIPEQQHIELYIRTGISGRIVTDIARGLNTGMQVAVQSIYNIDHVFDWLKSEIKNETYSDLIAWKESDAKEYDVRDLICILEIFNVFDFQNNSGKHPVSAYEKWSIPLDKFEKDFQKNRNHPAKSTYYNLRGILKGGLFLHDQVRMDFRNIHNSNGGRAGNLNIVEEASIKRGTFDFPFASLQPAKYRLTKGAAYPLLGALRNFVEISPNGYAQWAGGFDAVLQAWKQIGPQLVEETVLAGKELGNAPDQYGKSRSHWDKMHMKVRLHALEARLA